VTEQLVARDECNFFGKEQLVARDVCNCLI